MSNSDKWCKHYNGLNNDSCKVGVQYSVIGTDNKGLAGYHCLSMKATKQCENHELRTQQEIDDINQQIAVYVMKSNKLWTREETECPKCGKEVTSARQVGRCVYASCGCRMGQGELHEEWEDE
jgi:ribosomal protein S27AE